MHSKTLLASGFALLSVASARITGFYAPTIIAASQPVEILVRAENYIQKVTDIKIDFSFAPKGSDDKAELGTLPFTADQSNVVSNISFPITVPSWTIGQDICITGTLDQLYGTSKMPITETFEATVAVLRSTSGDYVASTQVLSN